MISLRLGAVGAPRERREGTWGSVPVAVALTGACITGMSLAWHLPAVPRMAPSDREAAREQVVRLALPAPRIALPPDVERVTPPARAARPSEIVSVPRGSGAATAPSTMSASPAAVVETPAPSDPLAPAWSTRLLPSRQAGPAWYSAPRVRNPFVHGGQISAAERDSTLGALGALVPSLAAERRATQDEVDARAKEAMLKMRLTGRILLVPPDNSGGLITASVPLPFLGGRTSSEERRRTSDARTAARSIQERLKQRADSLKRARTDSLARRVGSP
jgi:hypothetical protein